MRRSARRRSRPARPQPTIRPIRKRAGRSWRRPAACSAVCDFVGSDKSLQFATGVLARGGKVVVTGLLGGTFSIAAAMFAIKAMTIEGTLTGTLAEARELLDLARAGKIAPIPTHDRPLGRSAGRARRSARRPRRRPHGAGGF